MGSFKKYNDLIIFDYVIQKHYKKSENIFLNTRVLPRILFGYYHNPKDFLLILLILIGEGRPF